MRAQIESPELRWKVPVIPTQQKERLPQGFSYPLGAQAVSDLLGELPQTDKVELYFSWRDEFWVSKWQKRIKERGEVKLVSVSYSPTWDVWRVYIYSVPSDCNKAAKDYLLGGPLLEFGDVLRCEGQTTLSFSHEIMWKLPAVT